MKKLVSLKGTRTLNRSEQRSIFGGSGGPCPCTQVYTDHGDGSCSFPALLPRGFVCNGEIENGVCCV